MSSLLPQLDPDTYLFCPLPLGSKLPFRPLMVFEEAEGLTIVLSDYQAKSLGYEGSFPCRRIILGVESKLEDLGLIALVASALSSAGIPSNMASAFHHDHVFVPVDKAESAMAILTGLVWP